MIYDSGNSTNHNNNSLYIKYITVRVVAVVAP